LWYSKDYRKLFYTKNALARILTSDFNLYSNILGDAEGVFDNILRSSVEQAVRWGFDAMKVFLILGVNKSVLLSNIK